MRLSVLATGLAAMLAAGGATAAGTAAAAAASASGPPQLAMKILLVGEGQGDVTTAAWRSALDSEGVPYTLATASGTPGSETVSLPALSSGGAGNYNGVVVADSPADYAAGALSPLTSYESSFGVRQVDGYMYPSPALGVTDATSGPLDGTTATLTSAGLAAFGQLKGPVPFDTGSYGYGATIDAGAPYTSFLTDSAGHTMGGVYQHPDTGISELALNFDYNANQLQWLLLAPGLINWVTQDTHLGLYRNYFGQDIDDTFLADNEWSSQYQCTPAATDPPDFTCPPAEQAVAPGSAPGVPADVLMTASDVDHVVSWEHQTGIRLELAFNGIGACTADTASDESSANCAGSYTDGGTTYTDPGQSADPSYPNNSGLVNALLANQSEFGWVMHTWSHLFLGCTAWLPQALTSAAPGGIGGSLAVGTYSYEVTAATAYGESEPSAASQVMVGSGGSVTLTWPEAVNGTGTNGKPGPSLAAEEATHSGGTGFWGYNIYRENPGSTVYGLVGQVAENPDATPSTTYAFTDNGGAAGAPPDSSSQFPTATNPGIDCSRWLPASSSQPDNSIDAEIGLDQAFGAANHFTNYSPNVVVTGEHSGVENPDMSTALADTGITAIASDASRQPQQYSIGPAVTSPRYPSNIYYNASNWPDELNEYNTLYVAKGDSLGDPSFPSETGHCTDTSITTCLATPATRATLLGSETRIMLTHVLGNDPRVGYAHQSDLIGPATSNGQPYGYILLDLIDSMLGKYNAWFTASAPLDQMTDASAAGVLADQGAWAANAGQVSGTVKNGVVTLDNSGPAIKVPVTVPAGTTSGGSSFGQPYGGDLSGWVTLAGSGTQTLTESTGPGITSAPSATSIVGSAFSFTVMATGSPAPALSEAGKLPAGITFTDNGNGTATLAGTAAAGSGGSYPLTITASSTAGTATQSFTLTNAEAPAITSGNTASFSIGTAGTYQVTTTGYPAPAITESGTLPSGLTFTDHGDGTAAISGTPAAGTAGTYPVTISASNSSGSTASLVVTITVGSASAPVITSPATADFTLGTAGAAAITATGSPTPAITESGTLPPGLTFADGGNGTALLSGTPTQTGTTSLTIKAANGVGQDATQAYTVVVGQPPAFTSAASATAQTGAHFAFTVTTSGYPAPSFGWSNVPPGLTFTDNGDGTATLSGTPTTPGSYAMPLAAASAFGTAQQTLTVTVQQSPAITSAASAAFTVGSQGSFTVTTTGSPAPAITESGSLPAGVTLTDNGDGTATLAGTPATGTKGSYPVTIRAANGVSPDAAQSFTLTVGDAPAAPAITSAGSATFTVGTQGTFTVTTTGSPVASISASSSPALPSGVTFADNGDGTATLAGTPAAGSAGRYALTITASNGVSPDASQAFTLVVGSATSAPVITSANATTFAAGQAGTFSVTTTGSPAASISASSSPALPSGVTFTDNGDGTATLAGTPKSGSQGTYALTVTASNAAGTATQDLTLTVSSGLAITSASSATLVAGQSFSFTVTTTGTPTPTLSKTGSLPSGISWAAGTNGTATLSGTAAASDHGIFPLTFTAKNATGVASQVFTLIADAAPVFTSSGSVTETAGTPFSYLVVTRAYPAAALSGASLPAGVSFSDNGNGTGTLSGTAAAGTSKLVITAANSGGTASQTITLAVKAAGSAPPVPAFTSPAAAAAALGQPLAFTVTTAGSPLNSATITRSGALPGGVTLTAPGDGTAAITGIPTSSGVYPVTLTAKNAAGTTTQVFVLTVTAPPAITTGAKATATVGSGFGFLVRASGWPTPTLTEAGALPQGLTWTDNGNGTASLAGTPGVNQGGTYALTITAASQAGTATQQFTLAVNQPPAITSAPSATATRGQPFSFTFTSTGYPAAYISHLGSVPGLSFSASRNGTVTLSGTPTAAGFFGLQITATNSYGSDVQTFMLKVS